MKNIPILIFMFLILISFNLKTKAQEDTVIIENSTEPIKESDYKQKRKYKYLDNNLRVEKTIFKLGIFPTNFSFTSGLSEILELQLGIEKKVTPSFAIIVDNKTGSDDNMNRNFTTSAGIRFYYLINKRIREKTGANNFHGNYFSIKLDNCIRYGMNYEWVTYQQGLFYLPSKYGWTYKPYLNLAWGMQRRLAKRFFVDIGPYLKIDNNVYVFGLNMNIGLAWGLKI